MSLEKLRFGKLSWPVVLRLVVAMIVGQLSVVLVSSGLAVASLRRVDSSWFDFVLSLMSYALDPVVVRRGELLISASKSVCVRPQSRSSLVDSELWT